MRRIKMTGNKYGRLVVVEEAGKQVLAECVCGNMKWYLRGNVLAGYTQSCGCFRDEQISAANTTHGYSLGTGTYSSWQAMWKRCTDPNWHAYHRYGGRGIMIEPSWKEFMNFLSDMGERPAGMELDRNDNNGNYTKANCRWITHLENCKNKGG